ncbi:MAG: hypothetical protein K6G12_07015 [Lachnospiraceae bacterium]|nr:hypothetical protein [Lachnospiraceae bacterium]
MNDEMIVGGFVFGTAADAKLAREELERIEYLDSNMNYANTSKVMQLYDKALDTKMFHTPVGWRYMGKLKNILLESGYIEEEIRPIPLYNVFARSEENHSVAERIRPAKRKPDPYKGRFYFSMMITGVLVAVVIAMFVIALKSETPNMINYRNAIINEYADWEQELKDREDTVRMKERELNIVSPLTHEEQKTLEAQKSETEGTDKDE